MQTAALANGRVKVLSASGSVIDRTKGSITGSRTAGAMGRIPIESVCRDKRSSLEKLGFRAGTKVITAMSWVDNISVIGRIARVAKRAMQIIEEVLTSEWSLALKPDSKLALLPAGSNHAAGIDEDFAVVTSMPVLGHIIDSKGGIRECWTAARNAMWKAFWANFNGKAAISIDDRQKMGPLK